MRLSLVKVLRGTVELHINGASAISNLQIVAWNIKGCKSNLNIYLVKMYVDI